MDLKYLNAFYYVADELSFNKAAEKLHIAPSAVTRQIKLLEESYGHQLLIRNPKMVKLTPFGKKLYLQTQTFFRELNLDAPLKISIGCLQSIFESSLKSALVKEKIFWKESLDKVVINDSDHLEKELLDGNVNFIITNKKTSSSDVSIYNFGHEKYQIVSRHKITNQMLAESTWILINSTENIFNHLKIKSNSVVEVNSLNAGLQLILSGFGIGILPISVSIPNGFDTKILNTKEFEEPLYLIVNNLQKNDRLLDVVIKKLLSQNN